MQSLEKFYAMVNKVPSLTAGIWDDEKNVMDEKYFKQTIAALSSGEKVLLKFFASVWKGTDSFGFDLVDDWSSLDEPYQQIIINWLKAPFWP